MSQIYSRMLLVSANTETSPYAVVPLGIAFLEAALTQAVYEVRVWGRLLRTQNLNFWMMCGGLTPLASLCAITRQGGNEVRCGEYLPFSRRLADQPA
jgi:hypothetical protein